MPLLPETHIQNCYLIKGQPLITQVFQKQAIPYDKMQKAYVHINRAKLPVYLKDIYLR